MEAKPKHPSRSEHYHSEKWVYVEKGRCNLCKVKARPVDVAKACREGGASLVVIELLNDHQCVLKLY